MTLQELTAQTPVGECFEWKGEKYLVCETTSITRKNCIKCESCDFNKIECCDYDDIYCLSIDRIDEKSVYFVKQTPNEK